MDEILFIAQAPSFLIFSERKNRRGRGRNTNQTGKKIPAAGIAVPIRTYGHTGRTHTYCMDRQRHKTISTYTA